MKVGNCKRPWKIPNGVTELISEQFSESWLDDSSLAKLCNQKITWISLSAASMSFNSKLSALLANFHSFSISADFTQSIKEHSASIWSTLNNSTSQFFVIFNSFVKMYCDCIFSGDFAHLCWNCQPALGQRRHSGCRWKLQKFSFSPVDNHLGCNFKVQQD